jgi:hypothetical protein
MGSRIAGEANSPGTYSKRTVNLLGSLDKTDAQLFTTLCGFTWSMPGIHPLIYDEKASIYTSKGVNFDSLTHLDDIGLVRFEPLAGFDLWKLPQRITFSYYNNQLVLQFRNLENNKLHIGKILLTKTGHELVRICRAKPIDGFYDYVVAKWSKEGLVVSN